MASVPVVDDDADVLEALATALGRWAIPSPDELRREVAEALAEPRS